MTTSQKETTNIAADVNGKKANPQQTRSKKNKKIFVYVPEANKENKANNSKDNTKQVKSVKQAQESSQKKENNPKKNKKQFVYNPEAEKLSEDEKKKQMEEQILKVAIPPMNNQTKVNEKESESHKKENNSKKNKKMFVYVPDSEKNNKNENYKIDKRLSKDELEKQMEKDNFIDIKISMNYSDPLELVSVIRDALFNSLDKNVDIIRFVPGKNSQPNEEIGQILRILVLLTSKRLGFESSISQQENIITCQITSKNKTSAFVPHMPNKDEQEDLNRNDTLLKAFGMKTGDNLNIDNLSFRAVKSRFPHMPTICIAIICVKRTPKEAVEFAQLFENSLRLNNKLEISKDNENDELLNEMKIIKLLAEKYGFEKDLINHVVEEKKKQNNSKITLDKFSNDNSNELLKLLASSLRH